MAGVFSSVSVFDFDNGYYYYETGPLRNPAL
jgi:hypothetical protein